MTVTSGLAEVWRLEDKTGSLAGQNLADFGLPYATFSAGKLGNAAWFVPTNDVKLYRPSSTVTRCGPGPFAFAVWANLTSKGDNRSILSKDSFFVAGGREYSLQFNNSSDRFNWIVWTGGGGAGARSVAANSFGSPSLNVWHFIVVAYDPDLGQISIQVDNGPIDTNTTSPIWTETADFLIGNTQGGFDAWHGGIDMVSLWKNYKLSSLDRTWLWNGGTGQDLPYPALGAVVSQAAVEVFTVPDAQRARVTQAAVEAYVVPDTQRARVTQVALETVTVPTTQEARVTQVVIETVTTMPLPSTRAVPLTAALQKMAITRSVPLTASLSVLPIRNVPLTGALSQGQVRVVPLSASLGLGRGVVLTAALAATRTRTVSFSAATIRRVDRVVPLTLSTAGGQRAVPLTISIAERPTIPRQVPLTAAVSFRITEPITFTFNPQLSAVAHLQYQGHNAQQVLHVMDATGGVWSVLRAGFWMTAALPWNVSASVLQAALEALTTIGVGNIAVSGGPGGTAPFLVEFVGALAETPQAPFTTDSSGLTGPAGLDPHAAVRSLSVGYSQDDDYGLLDDVVLSLPRFGSLISYQGRIADLTFSKADQGGDQTATFTIIFTPPYGVLPQVGDPVFVSDKRGTLWGGLLEEPSVEIDATRAVIKFNARGYFTLASDLPYAQSRTFVANTTVGKIVQTMRNELTQGQFSPDNSWIALGKNIFEETDLYKRTLASVLSDYAALGDADDVPLVYGARIPRVAGVAQTAPILYLERERQPEEFYKYRVYLADGVRVTVQWDATEVVNRYYVEYQQDTIRGVASKDYGEVVPGGSTLLNQRLRAQFGEGAGATNLHEAGAYAATLVKRHGGLLSSSCGLHIPGGCPVYDDVSGHVLPASRIEPNQRIHVADWPDGLPPVDWRITTMSWKQSNGDVELQTGRAHDIRREIRRAATQEIAQSTQPGDAKQPYVVPRVDKPTAPVPPYRVERGTGTGGMPNPAVIPPLALPADVRVGEPQWALPAGVPEVYGLVPADMVLIQATALAPVDTAGDPVEIVIARSTYDSYGSRSNLTSLHLSGVNGKDRKTIEQQLFAGDVLYISWATPPAATGGYPFVTIGLVLEKR